VRTSFFSGVVASCFALSSCSLFKVKGPELYDTQPPTLNECTDYRTAPIWDLVGAVGLVGLGALMAAVPETEGEPRRSIGERVGLAAAFGVPGVLFGVSSYIGFSRVSECVDMRTKYQVVHVPTEEDLDRERVERVAITFDRRDVAHCDLINNFGGKTKGGGDLDSARFELKRVALSYGADTVLVTGEQDHWGSYSRGEGYSCAQRAAQPATGCTKDTDCKGDRICQAGACVDPAPAPTP
jgi:hypothetical protein